MNDRRDNEEREALIAGELDHDLGPDERADLAFLADILADPAVWAEPSVELEDAVVDAVGAAEPAELPAKAPQRRPRWFAPAAIGSVAAAIAIIFGVVAFANNRSTSGDFTATLAATPLAPGARASADVVHNAAGFRIVLDAHGLAPLPEGEYYQGWLKNDRGTLVPIGTFSSSDGKVTLWSGVSPKDFPKLTVTIEATDNNQASSGRIVLAGMVHTKNT